MPVLASQQGPCGVLCINSATKLSQSPTVSGRLRVANHSSSTREIVVGLGVRRKTTTFVVGLGCLFAALSGKAIAQVSPEAVTVLDRPRPEYQAVGIPLGAFTAFPSLGAAVATTDNIFASATAAKSDIVYSIQPELVIKSNWSRNELQLYLRGDREQAQKFGTESTSSYQAGLSSQLTAGDGKLVTTADVGRYVEPRTSTTGPIGSRRPIEYNLAQASLTAEYAFNRLRISNRLDLQKYDFLNGRTTSGTLVFQHDRDVATAVYTARLDYALTPDTSLFILGAVNKRDYDLGRPQVSLDRDSRGIEAAAGSRFSLSSLVRGEFQLGYLDQDYDDPALERVKGFGTKASVEWLPTELQTVTLSASRAVRDATIPGSSGFLAGDYTIQGDHEFLRNLIVTARANFGQDSYQGVDRTDVRRSLFASANYLVNRRVGILLSYEHLNQQSKGNAAGPEFTINRLMLTSLIHL
jgi:hypothetical protein